MYFLTSHDLVWTRIFYDAFPLDNATWFFKKTWSLLLIFFYKGKQNKKENR